MVNATSLMLVALGGMLGALARYSTTVLLASRKIVGLPASTLLVNILGCFAMGALIGRLGQMYHPQNPWYLFLGVGFLGAFTTFSALGLESLLYYREGALGHLVLNLVVTAALGIPCVFFGERLFR